MAIPDYQTFMRPLLVMASDGTAHGIRDAIDQIGNKFGLSEDERSELLPSGEDNVVGRERIQQFTGALAGHAASKGVFFTTSSFSKTAIEFAQKVQQRIILIDGDMLTKLMVQYNVGVRKERTIHLKRINLDYFEEVSE